MAVYVVGSRGGVFDHQRTSTQNIEEVEEVNVNIKVELALRAHIIVCCHHDVIDHHVNVEVGVVGSQ